MNPKKPKVLLVEDSPVQARLVTEFASSALDIEWVDRLSAALARLAGGGIDAVLLDLSLPDSWGIDTLTRVVEAHPGVPVIVFSGGNREAIAGDAAERGAAGVLSKNGSCGGAIADAVREALARRGG